MAFFIDDMNWALIDSTSASVPTVDFAFPRTLANLTGLIVESVRAVAAVQTIVILADNPCLADFQSDTKNIAIEGFDFAPPSSNVPLFVA